jgi:peptidoglycan/LPS O-acetylase OafA/YrhL
MGLVRLFLALAVAVDHWRVWVLDPRDAPHVSEPLKLGFNAGYAVMFFFVISGFLITYTLGRNYSQDIRGAARFYGNRFIRIFSLYWPLVVVALLIVPGAWDQFAAYNPLKQLISVFLFGMDWSLAFWGAAWIKGLEPAWTLALELSFYVLAPMLMRSWKIAQSALLLFLGVRLGFVIANGPGFQGLWTYVFPPSSYCFFLLGHVICVAGARYRIISSPSMGLTAMAASLAVMTFAPALDFDSPRFWASILLFTLSLPGLFEATKNIRWMNALGDLSYPVYLVHGIVLSTGGSFLANALPLNAPYLSVSAVLALILLAAVAAHWFLEVPLANGMRRLIRPGWSRRARLLKSG